MQPASRKWKVFCDPKQWDYKAHRVAFMNGDRTAKILHWRHGRIFHGKGGEPRVGHRVYVSCNKEQIMECVVVEEFRAVAFEDPFLLVPRLGGDYATLRVDNVEVKQFKGDFKKTARCSLCKLHEYAYDIRPSPNALHALFENAA
jgi:hypothetical protein